MSPEPTISNGPVQASAPSRRLLVAGLAGIIIAAAFGLFWLWYSSRLPPLPETVSADEFKAAAAEFSRLFRREPTEADVWMLLAETAVSEDRLQTAVDCFTRIPSEHRRYGPSARFQEAQALLRLNDADKAESSFRGFLQLTATRPSLDPEHLLLARKWLVYLLAVELRFEERKQILQEMVRKEQFDAYDIKQLYFPSLLIWHSSLGSSRLQEFLKRDPHNLRLQTARARYLVAEGDLAAADQLLDNLCRESADDPGVILASLESSFEKANWPEFEKCFALAAEFSEHEPWALTLMRGELALHQRNWADAERWFKRVLSADHANPVCHMGLARVFQETGRLDERQRMQERSVILARIRVNLAAVDNASADAARSIADDAESLQLTEAADAFNLLAARIDGSRR